jgi:hypothetical protein
VDELSFDELTSNEARMFVLACEIDNTDRAFEPLAEDLPVCERLRELGILQRRMVDEGVAYDLTPAARTADRLSRLTETARASVN